VSTQNPLFWQGEVTQGAENMNSGTNYVSGVIPSIQCNVFKLSIKKDTFIVILSSTIDDASTFKYPSKVFMQVNKCTYIVPKSGLKLPPME
jgi:hypothetical protein